MNKPTPAPSQPNPVEHLQQGLRYLFMQTLRARQRIYGVETEMKLAKEGITPRMPVEFRSQFGEDLTIWDVLNGQRKGFFIEVGAFDGYDFSGTYALEAVGWTGLLIEAIPERFEQCKARRKASRVVNAAVSRRGSMGTTSFVVSDDVHGGMLSYLDRGNKHARDMALSNIPKKTVTVPLTTIDDLLEGHTGPIDAAIIDVEGVEIEVLQGFEIEKWKPKILILEDNDRGRDPALGNYMNGKPYVNMGWLEVNRVYIHKECTEEIERMKQMQRLLQY